MSNSNYLRIANWNGRSVHGKKLEFFDFLARHKVDIAIVTETWLTGKMSFLHPSYTCLRFDRDSNDAERGGGVLIVVRHGITFREYNTSTKVIETGGISATTEAGNLHILAAYFPGVRRRPA